MVFGKTGFGGPGLDRYIYTQTKSFGSRYEKVLTNINYTFVDIKIVSIYI